MAELRISEGRCQFCHRTAADVQKLISGDSAFICNECVEACHKLLQPAEPMQAREEPAERYLFQRLARHFDPLRPSELITASRTYPLRHQADLQLALDEPVRGAAHP